MNLHFKTALLFCLVALMFLPPSVKAQFGVAGKKKADPQAQQQLENNNGGTLDLENDPELLDAMEIFAGMSPQEMEETMAELKNMLGDDPETTEAIDQVMNEIKNMKASNVHQSSLKQMIADDEVAKATSDALKLIYQSSWDVIWGKQSDILDAVIQSGRISAKDAALYKSDPEAWAKELRFIWDELQKQAAKEEL